MKSDKNNWLLGYTLILLHIVGAAGSMHQDLRPLMQTLTPINLLLSCAILLYAHRGGMITMFSFFVGAACFGFAIEVIGVHSQVVFGSYSYGKSLGVKILDVPLIIGINWFLLALMFGSLATRLKAHWSMKAILASLLMVAMDYLIEPVAIFMDYWSWEQNQIPIRNYVGWFGGSLVLQVAYHKLKFDEPNPLAIYLLISQLIFFISIHFFLL